MKPYFIIACLLLFLSVDRAQAQKNLVTNGGFEDDLYGWNDGGAKITPWVIKSGKKSCAIITTNTDKWVGIDQTIRIPKKVQTLEFSAWLKTINVVRGNDEWNGAVFIVEFLDKQDKKIGDGVTITRVYGDLDWTLATQIVKVPAGAINFRILLAMGNASGTLLIDDVEAKAVSDDIAKS